MIKYLAGRIRSFFYAFRGIAAMLKSEPNARIHLVASVVVIIAGFYFRISPTEWMFVSGAIAFVWSMEALNTAIEALTDLVSPQFEKLAGKAKDCAAAGVLIAAIFAVSVALIIFIPRIF